MLTHDFNEDRSKLIFRITTKKARRELAAYLKYTDGKGSISQAAEYLDSYLGNCELQWIDPSDTGAPTDAPMLGIVGGDDDRVRVAEGPYGAMLGGCDGEGEYWYPILERWAYMSYAVRSFLEDLRDDGEAVFVNSN